MLGGKTCSEETFFLLLLPLFEDFLEDNTSELNNFQVLEVESRLSLRVQGHAHGAMSMIFLSRLLSTYSFLVTLHNETP